MSLKKTLIDWIHRVEVDPIKKTVSQRLPSIISELFFEKVLCKRQELDLPQALAFGWAYRQNWGSDGRTSRTWFKISEKKYSSISRVFIKAIKAANVDDEFFLVVPAVSIRNGGFPSIAWQVRQLVVLPDEKIELSETKSSEEFEENITQRVDVELSRRTTTIGTPTIVKWLDSLPDCVLERLLATRCLMNFAGLYLSDVDAVGVNPEGGLELLEFKRKDPARGTRYQPLRQPDEKGGLDLYLCRIDPLRGMGLGEVQAALNDKKTWSAMKSGPGFGLDTSHVRTVDLCARAGIRYRYLIWYSSARHPRDLLTPEWKPLANVDLRVADLTEESFDGLTCTNGNDSGSYNKGVRFQLVVPVAKFVVHGIAKHEF